MYTIIFNQQSLCHYYNIKCIIENKKIMFTSYVDYSLNNIYIFNYLISAIYKNTNRNNVLLNFCIYI